MTCLEGVTASEEEADTSVGNAGVPGEGVALLSQQTGQLALYWPQVVSHLSERGLTIKNKNQTNESPVSGVI